MSKLIIGASLALVCLSHSALAQEFKTKHAAAAPRSLAAGETLDASMARLAVKAALQPQAQPTPQELLGVILLMSLRDQKASRT